MDGPVRNTFSPRLFDEPDEFLHFLGIKTRNGDSSAATAVGPSSSSHLEQIDAACSSVKLLDAHGKLFLPETMLGESLPSL